MASPRIVSKQQQSVKSSGDLPATVEDIKLYWKKCDGAGLSFLEQSCRQLAGYKFEKVAKDLASLLGPVFQFAESEQVLSRMREIEKLVRQEEKQSEKTASQQTLILQCLLLFIKLQTDYHQLCTSLLSSAIDHLTSMCSDDSNLELANQLKTLDLSATNYAKLKKPSMSGRSSPRLTKQGLKASIFSFFERKNATEDGGNSAFYVDIDKDLNDNGTKREDGLSDEKELPVTLGDIGNVHVEEEIKSEMLIDFGLDQGPDAVSEDSQKSDIPVSTDHKALLTTEGGHVASQEELDSVIRFLSGGNDGRYADSALNALDFCDPYKRGHSDHCEGEEMSNSKTEGQRRSEGSIDVTGFMSDWHSHRATLPGRHVFNTTRITCDLTTPPPPFFSGTQYRPNTLPPGGAGHFQAAYGMSFPDPSLNRTWPVNNLALSGSVMDTISGSWSGGHDSDEGSDDSSVGDHFQKRTYLQDLSKDERADSLQYRCTNNLGLVNRHSSEDLLDSRSHTWPQHLQPWSHTSMNVDLMAAQEYMSPAHRLASVQMSDPLSSRNLWQNFGNGGCLKQQEQQAVRSGLDSVQ